MRRDSSRGAGRGPVRAGAFFKGLRLFLAGCSGLAPAVSRADIVYNVPAGTEVTNTGPATLQDNVVKGGGGVLFFCWTLPDYSDKAIWNFNGKNFLVKDGTVTVTGSSDLKNIYDFDFGDPGYPTTYFNIWNGHIQCHHQFCIGAHGSGTTGSQTGGELECGNFFLGGYTDKGTGNSTYTQSGGTVTAGSLDFGDGGKNGGTYKLNGGTLSVKKVHGHGDNAGHKAALALGGGTLRATADNPDFISHWVKPVDVTLVTGTSSTIDTGPYQITIKRTLSGAGALVKEGAGRLGFAADQTYTGATTVNKGKLAFGGAVASSGFTLAEGASLGLGLAARGKTLGGITVNGSAALHLPEIKDQRLNAGAVALNAGRLTIDITGSDGKPGRLPVGTSTLVSCSSLTVGEGASVALWGLHAGQTAEVAADPANKRIVVTASPVARRFWNGGEGGVWRSGGGGWLAEDGSEANWANGLTAVFTNAGSVTAGIAEEGVTANAVRFEGAGAVTFTNGAAAFTNGALTLAGDAEIAATNGADIRLDVPLAGRDGLTLFGNRKTDFSFPGFLTKNDQTVFPGIKLAEIDCGAIGARLGGTNIFYGVPANAAACNAATNTGGSVSVQFQVKEGANLKCVLAVFSDGADGVRAKASWARYISDQAVGYNFTGQDQGGEKPFNLATSADGQGYGAFGLTATAPGTESGKFVIGRPAVFSGKLEVKRGLLEFGPGGRLGAYGVFEGGLANGGAVVAPPCLQVFAGPVSGTGRLSVRGLPDGGRLLHPGFLATTQSVFAMNIPLSSLPGISGIRAAAAGKSISAQGKPWQAFFIERTDDGITFDLQIYDGWTKCIAVEVIQQGRDIAARAIGAYNRDQGKNTVGQHKHDESGWAANTVVTAPDKWGYGAHGLEIRFDGPVPAGAAAVFRGDWGQWKGPGLSVETNAVLIADTENGLPPSGAVEVSGGGEIRCLARAGQTNPVRILPGGVLSLEGAHAYSAVGKRRDLFLEGGALRIPAGKGTDGGNYLYHLDVRDGGTVEGNPFRVSYKTDAALRVRGNAPCLVKSGILLFPHDDDPPHTFTMDVGDVAEGPDLVVSGRIAGDKTPMIKTGAGTAVYSGRNTQNCETRIEAGILRFETDSAMGAGAGSLVTLDGGALDIGGRENAVGALKLLKDGTLDIRGGGRIEFADSAGIPWAEGKTLRIDGDISGRRVRFGTDGNGLVADQIRQIRLKDKPGMTLCLDRAGWLIPPGTVIIFR